jgi:hypothetical protein
VEPDKRIAERLASWGAGEMERVKRWLQQFNDIERTVALIEACRELDVRHVLQYLTPSSELHLTPPLFDTMRKGWNPALALLLSEHTNRPAIPLMESTVESRSASMTLLQQLGRSVLLRETAERIRFGLAEAADDGSRITIRRTERASIDFWADRLEHVRYANLERRLRASTSKGSSPDQLKALKTRMTDLIFPWKTSRGNMIGYGGEEDIDEHYLSLVFDATIESRDEAGIHPDAMVGSVPGANIISVGVWLISFYLKHIHFVDLGKQKYPDSNYAMSLTIWKPIADIESSISHATGMSQPDAASALKLFTASHEWSNYLLSEFTPAFPMLIAISNQHVLAPVCGMFGNPFNGIRALQEHISQATQASIREPREDWMRVELARLFAGNRYRLPERPVVLKRNGQAVTDIDAAVFDTTTGELALFQLKWQDFDTHDLKRQRSKAKNFIEQTDKWAKDISSWIDEFGCEALLNALQLRITRAATPVVPFLFAIGRSASRFQSYGYVSQVDSLASCMWKRFIRLRFEVGPASKVFSALHNRIRSELTAPPTKAAIPFEIEIDGQRIEFADMWTEYPPEVLSESVAATPWS